MRAEEWMAWGGGGVSRGQTTWGLQAGWWVGLNPKAVRVPEGLEAGGVYIELRDLPYQTVSLLLGGHFCGHMGPVMPQNGFLSQALMPNPLITSLPSSIAHLWHYPGLHLWRGRLEISHSSRRTSGSGLLTTLTMNLQWAKPRPPITDSNSWTASFIKQGTWFFSFLFLMVPRRCVEYRTFGEYGKLKKKKRQNTTQRPRC